MEHPDGGLSPVIAWLLTGFVIATHLNLELHSVVKRLLKSERHIKMTPRPMLFGNPFYQLRQQGRKKPNGLTLFDANRSEEPLNLQESLEGFEQCFSERSKRLLEGMDWSNMLVAGGMPLSVLRREEVPEDDICDVDIFLYGLNSEEANRKLRQICKAWEQVVGDDVDRLLHRAPSVVNLLAGAEFPKLQIILTLYSSAAQVMQRFDLDQCAIGYDGSNVVLLSRCVRALQTGYTKFSMDLIDGRGDDRNATRGSRIIKYEGRNFGVYIPQKALNELGKEAEDRVKDVQRWAKKLSEVGRITQRQSMLSNFENFYAASSVPHHQEMRKSDDFADDYEDGLRIIPVDAVSQGNLREILQDKDENLRDKFREEVPENSTFIHCTGEDIYDFLDQTLLIPGVLPCNKLEQLPSYITIVHKSRGGDWVKYLWTLDSLSMWIAADDGFHVHRAILWAGYDIFLKTYKSWPEKRAKSGEASMNFTEIRRDERRREQMSMTSKREISEQGQVILERVEKKLEAHKLAYKDRFRSWIMAPSEGILLKCEML